MADCEHKDAYFISGRHWYCDGCGHVYVIEKHLTQTRVSDEATREVGLDAKIDIFASRQESWFFRPARALLDNTHDRPGAEHENVGAGGELAAACIVGGYFEGIQHFRDGHPDQYRGPKYSDASQGDKFKYSLARILSATGTTGTSYAAEAGSFYKLVRNGLFHAGMTYAPVRFGPSPSGKGALFMFVVTDPLTGEKTDYLHVDLSALLDIVEADFNGYVQGLRSRNGDEVNFEKCWDEYWKKS